MFTMCKILCKVDMFNTVLNLQNGCLLCEIRHAVTIDLAGILGDAWRAPKVGWYGRGVPSQPTRGSGGALCMSSGPAGSGSELQPKTDFGVF